MTAIQYDVSKKAELDSECPCFHQFPERRFERNEGKVKHSDLQGDFQQSQEVTLLDFERNVFFCNYKMRSSRWRPRSRLFISKRPKSRRCCATFT
jgi:hypothetical protein